ncbi:UDP-2,3-diacylglucosamine hydrolase [Catalinimonas alkaloidigena]|uniref:UDP-2,3-diacylglucosamine hydrolase n=1 Tax=Catalinimonas alkaloidigena TaxID=1075417 RepID=A0A1G9LXB3_9BACT|nr:UDP-2,3-diacylglucosamine diphosphatase [Catalinimonas alkaloidigena]SDL66474.1 UDP-2,3-diacylglucosamine hydrolase [Catalinimonas alkaloidigena]
MVSLVLPADKKAYFVSDFHLGAPTPHQSRLRERKVVAWLEQVQADAGVIFLIGDLFDFWFEYRHAIPKGFTRFLGKLAELADAGIDLRIFTGNHDMWMAGYFQEEFGLELYRQPRQFLLNDKKFLIGHGDGLGPGDGRYKIIKQLFQAKPLQHLFRFIHPDVGMQIAHTWSRSSRKKNQEKDLQFLGDDEWLLAYCRQVEAREHHDYYVFGHRHLPLDLDVTPDSRYINTGEWLQACTYAEFDGKALALNYYQP